MRIIVADEDKAVRDQVGEILTPLNSFEVIAWESSGVDAVYAIEKHKPDIVITSFKPRA